MSVSDLNGLCTYRADTLLIPYGIIIEMYVADIFLGLYFHKYFNFVENKHLKTKRRYEKCLKNLNFVLT